MINWRRWIWPAGIATVLIAAIAYAYWPRPVPVDIVEVRKAPMAVTVEDDGVTRVRETYMISAPIAGRVLRIETTRGDRLFISLLLAAYIHLLWLGTTRLPLWGASIVALIVAVLVFLIALFSTVAHLFLIQAFVRADMVVLMPFDFTRLLFVAVFAYLLFGEIMDGYTALGALIIVGSTAYIAHREARKKIPPSAIPAEV